MEPILEDVGDVGRQAAVGLPAEVGDVHRDPPSRLEGPHTFREHVLQHLQVLPVGRRHALGAEVLLVRLAGEVGR